MHNVDRQSMTPEPREDAPVIQRLAIRHELKPIDDQPQREEPRQQPRLISRLICNGPIDRLQKS